MRAMDLEWNEVLTDADIKYAEMSALSSGLRGMNLIPTMKNIVIFMMSRSSNRKA